MGLFSGDRKDPAIEAANTARKDQLARIDALNLPDEEKMKLILETPELMGVLESENIDPSKNGHFCLVGIYRRCV